EQRAAAIAARIRPRHGGGTGAIFGCRAPNTDHPARYRRRHTGSSTASCITPGADSGGGFTRGGFAGGVPVFFPAARPTFNYPLLRCRGFFTSGRRRKLCVINYRFISGRRPRSAGITGRFSRCLPAPSAARWLAGAESVERTPRTIRLPAAIKTAFHHGPANHHRRRQLDTLGQPGSSHR